MTGHSRTYRFLFFALLFVTLSSFCGYMYSMRTDGSHRNIFEDISTNGIWKKINFLQSDYLKDSSNMYEFMDRISQRLSELVPGKTEDLETKILPSTLDSWKSSGNKTGFILFTTWVDNSEKTIIHRNVVRTWRKWKPLIKPLFFYSNISTGRQLQTEGWLTEPVSKTACGDANMPTIRDMFLDAIKKYDSVLYGYANGDITFDNGMPLAISEIVKSNIVREKPVLVLVRRTNVDFSNGTELDETSDITEMYANGKALKDGSSDGFFTNSLFPWQYVPDVVVGRIGIGMWLVSYARAMNATVIDITKTVKAIHMTTKSGNHESHFKPNGRCNHNVYGNLGVKPTSWGCGFITCATIDVMLNKKGETGMRYKNPRTMDKKCGQCSMDLRKILPKSMGIQGRTFFGQNIGVIKNKIK